MVSVGPKSLSCAITITSIQEVKSYKVFSHFLKIKRKYVTFSVLSAYIIEGTKLLQHQVDPDIEAEVCGERKYTPEQILMLYLVLQFKQDLIRDCGKSWARKKQRNAALHWFRQKKPATFLGRPYLFSFVSICEELDWDANTVRRKLLGPGQTIPKQKE